MAASAYGALVSLMYVLDNIQHPARKQLHFDRHQIETLCKKVTFLLDFLENFSEILCDTDAEDLARQIAYAVDEAEEVIDCHVVDQLSQRSVYEVDLVFSSFREDIERVLNKIESLEKELMMVKDRERSVKEPQPRVSVPAAGSSALPLSGKINTMVGFDHHLLHIMDHLTGHGSDLQIVPITGMGGIGKTTLAQNVFDNRCIVDRFDICKWITISQSYSIRDVLLDVLGEPDRNQKLAELGGKLHKILFGRRYLIVMDDVWSTEVWDELRLFLPENRNGSRVIVTTRLSNVAISLGSQKSYLLDFLDEEKSWNLFCIKVFGKEVCPNPELEKIGKKIVECCKGLPLAITVIGGLLGKSNMTQEDWELVGKDVMRSLDDSKDEGDCSNILSLSYKHLPIHLKSCFLYMRTFHEDEKIDVITLIDYWIAEGLVRPKEGKTLEEVAENYLKDLIDRNMILIHNFNVYTWKIRACKVHDLLRELCIREYEKEHFFRISKVQHLYLRKDTCPLCCYRKNTTSINLPQLSTITPLPTTLFTCFVCDICNVKYSQHNRLRLVMVVDNFILQPTRLRYLEVDSCLGLESPVLPLLWNLHVLRLRDRYHSRIELPTEIWAMPQLRRLSVLGSIYVDPPVTQMGSTNYVILENLHTLMIENNMYSEETFKRIPNVKTLAILYGDQSEEFAPVKHQLHNFADLRKLDFLLCTRINLEYISFPDSLRILQLTGCNSPWERMTVIGSLPNLEGLILTRTFEGPEWNPTEGGFLRLKTLAIEDNDLVWWNAEKHHFPKLEILQLVNMKCLEKIPSGIGEIETLREIRLRYTTESAVQSAEEIIEEQRDYGNEDLQLRF